MELRRPPLPWYLPMLVPLDIAVMFGRHTWWPYPYPVQEGISAHGVVFRDGGEDHFAASVGEHCGGDAVVPS